MISVFGRAANGFSLTSASQKCHAGAMQGVDDRENDDLGSMACEATVMPPAVLDPSETDSLGLVIAVIRCGIARRQFHITNGDGLKPLWVEGLVSFREKLRRLEHFAEAHEWDVTSKDRLALVLFQPRGGTKLLSGGSSHYGER